MIRIIINNQGESIRKQNNICLLQVIIDFIILNMTEGLLKIEILFTLRILTCIIVRIKALTNYH